MDGTKITMLCVLREQTIILHILNFLDDISDIVHVSQCCLGARKCFDKPLGEGGRNIWDLQMRRYELLGDARRESKERLRKIYSFVKPVLQQVSDAMHDLDEKDIALLAVCMTIVRVQS